MTTTIVPSPRDRRNARTGYDTLDVLDAFLAEDLAGAALRAYPHNDTTLRNGPSAALLASLLDTA